MPSTYTLNNGIELIGTGEQSGTWGDTTNTNLELLDSALDGQVTVTLASAGSSGSPNALPISDGAASNGRNRMVIFDDGGDLGATAFVQLTPNDAEKIIYVRNDLSGSRSIILFQGTYNASNDYEVPAGTTAVVFFDGAGSGAVAANVFNNAYFDSLRLGSVSVTAILDEDNMSSDSATALATQQSIKAYVDSQVTAQDLDFAGDSGTGAVDLDSQSLTIAGTANEIETSASGQTVTVGLPDAVTIADLTATTADINGGTIDGTVIGGSTPAAGSFTTLSASTSITGTLATAAQTNITSVGSLTSLDVTGTVTADGLTVGATVPIVRLDSPATAWAGGEDLGGVDWYTEDTSASGPAVMARIYSESSGTNTLPIPNMIFQTSVADVTLKDRMQIAGTGDISFYEDTGTTAKFFWDASYESLDIGSALSESVKNFGTNTKLGLAGSIILEPGSGNEVDIFNYRTTNLNLGTGGSADMTIDSSGQVGIGTSSPNKTLEIRGDASNGIRIQENVSGGDKRLELYVDTADSAGAIAANQSAQSLKFLTTSTERMRIDSSGNLLVGQTTANSNATGIGALPYGSLYSCRDGGAPFLANRKTSDGDIALFQKDGTTVGSIGTKNGALHIGSTTGSDSYFGFYSNQIIPTTSDGSDKDAVTDLGYSDSRFKDLYLSGGVYLGGTGSANKLDDYEEGTWLPSLEFASPGGTATTQNSIYTTGSYVKIGSAVTVQFNINQVVFGNGTGNVYFKGLPFTPNGISAYAGKNQASSGHLTSAVTASGYVDILKIYGVNPLNVMFSTGSGAWDFLNNTNATTVAPNSINGSFTYYTNS